MRPTCRRPSVLRELWNYADPELLNARPKQSKMQLPRAAGDGGGRHLGLIRTPEPTLDIERNTRPDSERPDRVKP